MDYSSDGRIYGINLGFVDEGITIWGMEKFLQKFRGGDLTPKKKMIYHKVNKRQSHKGEVMCDDNVG
ncbi:MAG: hypothetical protein C7B43_11870 [Sulfobacillus benefaciens]|uniref:Uncharacterized protein n=1 Tax=Sulfobacillus benefaciens TaxID=453960 RepID=A0A2T2WYX9_9FIRM|nr:MAG: hypothetical protein C7B43_11870 [Sulfobacillus benefaciens]HBQ96277.1 hypothetical protein [Sulfobacillus sp.]